MELYVLLESVYTADWIVNMVFQATIILIISQIARRLCVTCSAPTRSDLCFIIILLLLVLPFGSFVSTSVNSTKIQLIPLTEGRWNSGATPPNSLLSDAGYINAEQKSGMGGASRPTHAPRLETCLIYGVNLFGGIWSIGTLVMLMRLGHGLTYARSIRSELTRLESPRLQATLHAVMKVFDTKTLPLLYTSPLTNTPHTIGVLRPCIVLPVELCRTASDDELKSILLHEMSHIVHKDQWAGVLQRLVTALLWWNPLVYALSADFSEQREYICDNYAIRHVNPMVFATCLFTLAKNAREFRVLPTALCAVTSKSTLEHRIHLILSGGRRMKTTGTKTTFLFALIFSLVLAGGLVHINWTMAAQKAKEEITFVSPIQKGRITAKFGQNNSSVTTKPGFHIGIDIAVKQGTDIYAAADGTVLSVMSQYQPGDGYGKNIIIRHANGYTTRYAKLKEILVKEGQQVQADERIGLSGNTGRSTGPHLHFELMRDGKHEDPEMYIEFTILQN